MPMSAEECRARAETCERMAESLNAENAETVDVGETFQHGGNDPPLQQERGGLKMPPPGCGGVCFAPSEIAR